MSVARVLVIEDHGEAAATVVRILERAGYQARHVSTIAAADAMLAAWHPDSVLVDLTLPDGDGADLITRVRTARPPIRIVVMSGAVVAPTLDADAVLTKPATLRALLDAIAGASPAQ